MSFNITPNFDEAVEVASEPMPVGAYNARITALEQKTSQAGNAYLKAKFTVFGAEGELQKYNNWPIFGNFMLSGKGAGNTKMLLKAIFGEEIPASIQSEDLMGKEVVVSIKYEKDQATGETSQYPSIKAINKLN